jgi:hypothetical protein
MSFTPRNRHERRVVEAGHQHLLGGILAFPMSEVQDRLGISRSKAYEEIAAGRLIARKCGARTLITFASAQEWLDSLPLLAA